MRLLALLFCPVALAQGGVCSDWSFAIVPQPTIERAAVIALGSLIHRGVEVEYGGIIAEINGAFYPATPVTQNLRSGVTYCAPSEDYEITTTLGEARFVAAYHVHVSNSPTFGPRDKRNADRRNVPSFMATIHDGKLFRYDPETGETTNVGKIDASDPEAIRFVRAE